MKEIIFALIGGGFFAFIQFLITRYDNKHTCAIGFMIHSDLNVIYKRLENYLK